MLSSKIVYARNLASMAPKYKLTYLATYGLGEPIRYLLSYGNYNFEDIRVTWETWAPIKETRPFGRIPTLEFDGKTYHQSHALCRYLGTELKLNGSNSLENLEIDQIVDTMGDLLEKTFAIYNCKTEEDKQKTIQEIREIHVPYYLGRFENIAKENNGYLGVKKLTWADFYFLGFMDGFKLAVGDDVLDKYPILSKLTKKLTEISSIKTYIEKRPPIEPSVSW